MRSAPAPLGARTVLDRAWLRRTDPVDLARALLPVAGLRIIAQGDGVGRTVSLRGMAADRTAILVDGRPVNTAQGGAVDLSLLDLEEVGRIEVARGALGALYGPDALAGAVNLVRRTDRGPGTGARLLAGNEGRALLRVRSGFGLGRWSGSAAARLETAAPDLNGRASDSEGGGLHARLAWHPLWAAAVEASAEASRDRRDVPGRRDFPTPRAERTDDAAGTGLSLRGVAVPGLPGDLGLDLSGSVRERRYRDPGDPFGPVSDTHINRRLRAAASWTGSVRGLRTAVRVEAVRDRLDSSTDGRVGRDRGAGALVVREGRPRWGASAALRVDGLEGFAPHLTGRVGASRALLGTTGGGTGLLLRAGAGTSFRPPTFDDVFWPARAGAAGNRDLRPERSTDLDLGLEGRRGDSRVMVSAYLSRVRDLIQWSPGPDGVWRPHNVSAARVRGLEVEGSVDLAPLTGRALRLDGSASWLDPVDATGDPVTGGRTLVGRARFHAFGELSWAPGRWTALAGLTAVGRVPLTAANTKWEDGYVLVHAGLRRRISADLRLDLEGRNLFDTRYEDLRGYAVPGREILLGARWSLPGKGP